MMEKEKWITVEIGGYRRYIPESKLPQVFEDANAFIEKYVSMGIDRSYAEAMYKVEVLSQESCQAGYEATQERQGEAQAPTKGSEDMDGMTEGQTRKLIEWLKAQGFPPEKVVECLEYINSKK